jgi:hypothetical protein
MFGAASVARTAPTAELRRSARPKTSHLSGNCLWQDQVRPNDETDAEAQREHQAARRLI